MSEAPEYVHYEQDGAVVVITIDRPERMNAIGPEVHEQLVAAWGRFRDDDSALVGVLTGAGDQAFCAGGDLKSAFEGNAPVPTSAEEIDRHNRGEADGVLGPSRWVDLYKPTIAAINGVAYAGGLEWACWTDIAVADAHATFGVTCRRWNIGLADGGTQRLPRIVGFRRAMELIITGRVIDASEALSIGLVNEVVPSGTCRERAVELAHRIAALPSPRSGPTRRPPCAASGCPSTRACESRRSASTGCSTHPRSSKACASSTSASIPTAGRVGIR